MSKPNGGTQEQPAAVSQTLPAGSRTAEEIHANAALTSEEKSQAVIAMERSKAEYEKKLAAILDFTAGSATQGDKVETLTIKLGSTTLKYIDDFCTIANENRGTTEFTRESAILMALADGAKAKAKAEARLYLPKANAKFSAASERAQQMFTRGELKPEEYQALVKHITRLTSGSPVALLAQLVLKR